MPKLLCGCFQKEVEDVRVLDYRHCSLQDVPNDVFNFERTLEELYVDANQIKILPRELFYCHGVKKLTVSDNEITSIPPAIASLINLEEFDMSKNGILDLPENIKCCKYLRIVEASVNPLGKLPEGFTQLLSLTELYLNDTFLDYLPGNFGRLSKLKILEVRENHLRTLPKSMSRLTDLERLDIGNNDFNEMPEVIGSLTGLLELWCDSNLISRIIPEIGNLKQMMYLDASKNRIEFVPPEIEGCASLSDLHLSTNLLEELPETLGRLSNLTTLKLDDNQLKALPFSIGGLASLSEFNMSANDIEELPPSIGLLRCLRTLYADENLLIDLPPEIGSCTGLTVLSLRSNRLTYIPDEVGHIPRLRVLNLSDNQIQCLPFDLTKLKQLQALWLAENQSKPLIRLQTDLDSETGKRSLTCYLLPQQKLEAEDIFGDEQSFHPSMWEEERLQRQAIHFDFGDQSDHEDRDTKPLRSPTPYPKEMKDKIRHAKNLAMRQLTGATTDVRWNEQAQKLEKLENETGVISGSPEGEKVRGRRSRSGSTDDVDAAGQQKMSPHQEMHKLYKADKEKLLKDKERLQRQKSTSPERKTEEVSPPKSPVRDKPKAKESPTHTVKTDDKENKPLLDKARKGKSKTNGHEDDDGGFLMSRSERKASMTRSDTNLTPSQQSIPLLQAQPSPQSSRNYWLNPPAKAPSVAASDFAVYSQNRSPYHHQGYRNHRHRPRDYESDTASAGYRSDYEYHGARRHHGRDGYNSDRDASVVERSRSGYGSDFDNYSVRSAGPVAGRFQNVYMGNSPYLAQTPQNAPYFRRTTIRNDELYGQPMSSTAIEDRDKKREDRQERSFDDTQSEHRRTDNWKNQLYAVLEQRRQDRDNLSDKSSSKAPPPYKQAPPYNTPPAYRVRRPGVKSDTGSPTMGRKVLAEFGPSTARLRTGSDSEYKAERPSIVQQGAGSDLESQPESLNPRTPLGSVSENVTQEDEARVPLLAREPQLPALYRSPPDYKKSEERPERQTNDIETSFNSRHLSFNHYKSAPDVNGISDRSEDIPYPSIQDNLRASERLFGMSRQQPLSRNDSDRTAFQPWNPSRSVPNLLPESSQFNISNTSGIESNAMNPELDQGVMQPSDGRPQDARPYGSENNPRDIYHEKTPSTDSWKNKHGQMTPLSENNEKSNYCAPRGYVPQPGNSRDYDLINKFSKDSPHRTNPIRSPYEPPPHFQESPSQFQEPPPPSQPYEMERFEDVAKYKSPEPNSQVSSSTDSGYGHGHHIYERVERLTGYPVGTMPPPNRAPPSPGIVPPPGRDPPSLPISRETTPSRHLDSGHGSMDQPDLVASFTSANKSQLLPVVITKSPGLGFSIAGGVNSPGNPFRENDMGIFVTKVHPHGPACKVLRSGDKIVEVNGIDMTHILHDQAVNILKTCGQQVSLLIERPGLTATTI